MEGWIRRGVLCMHPIFDRPFLEIPAQPRKYFIASDLHLEWRQGQEKGYWEAFPSYPGVDTCLCAGDLTVFGQPDTVVFRHFNELCKRFDKVIYVPGNHEYYGSDPASVERRLGDIETMLRPVLTVLRAGSAYTWKGQRFLGDTMWFPDRPEVHIYRKMISDSFQIKGLFPWCFTQSHLFLMWLRGEMREDDIIITHHIPTDVDTLPQWKGGQTQAYFLNTDCERLLQNPNVRMPKAWIYGHTHDKHDYRVGRTHFICNPVGYPGERL